MAAQHDVEIKKLHKKIIDLKKAMAACGDPTELDMLLQVIHRPPWTTLREVAISAAMVDSATGHARCLAQTKTALLRAAKVPSK